MKIRRPLLFATMLTLLTLTAAAQETTIDLRKDGRVISGTRKDWLLQGVLSYNRTLRGEPGSRLALPLTGRLYNKLANSNVVAIVVPEGKLGDRFLIGLLIGDETLPEDFPVDEKDFAILRDYSRNKAAYGLEAKYRELKANAVGIADPKQDWTTRMGEFRTIATEARANYPWIDLYAGYLLAELAETPAMSKVDNLVIAYRREIEQLVNPLVNARIAKSQLSWFDPVDITQQDVPVTMADLNRHPVTRYASAPKSPSYLQVWHGRSLVVVPERPGFQFDPKVHVNLGGYFKTVKEPPGYETWSREDVVIRSERIRP